MSINFFSKIGKIAIELRKKMPILKLKKKNSHTRAFKFYSVFLSDRGIPLRVLRNTGFGKSSLKLFITICILLQLQQFRYITVFENVKRIYEFFLNTTHHFMTFLVLK